MASQVFRARTTALTALLGVIFASAAMAADMPFLSSEPIAPPVNQPVELGTGWYLRGDVGYSNMAVPVVIADFADNLGRTGAVSGGLGVGYQYNNWIRTDFTIDRAVFQPGGAQASRWCPYGTVLDYPAGAVNAQGQALSGPAGYLYDPNETCTPIVKTDLNRTTLLANAYVDIGNWWGITPYVGAGLGFSYLQMSNSVNYYENANGSLWQPNLGQSGVPIAWINPQGQQVTPPWAYPWTQLLPNQSAQKKSWKFAWNFMAGFSYDISQNLKIDLHYRFLDAGSYTSFPSTITGSGAITKDLYTQEVRLGFRLMSD